MDRGTVCPSHSVWESLVSNSNLDELFGCVSGQQISFWWKVGWERDVAGVEGEEKAGPCNKWLPVNSSVPSWEVSAVMERQAQASQPLHPSTWCFGTTPNEWGVPRAWGLLLCLSWVCSSVCFSRVLWGRKVFNLVWTDLTWINILWLDLGLFFRVLYSTLPVVVLLSILLFLPSSSSQVWL